MWPAKSASSPLDCLTPRSRTASAPTSSFRNSATPPTSRSRSRRSPTTTSACSSASTPRRITQRKANHRLPTSLARSTAQRWTARQLQRAASPGSLALLSECAPPPSCPRHTPFPSAWLRRNGPPASSSSAWTAITSSRTATRSTRTSRSRPSCATRRRRRSTHGREIPVR